MRIPTVLAFVEVLEGAGFRDQLGRQTKEKDLLSRLQDLYSVEKMERTTGKERFVARAEEYFESVEMSYRLVLTWHDLVVEDKVVDSRSRLVECCRAEGTAQVGGVSDPIADTQLAFHIDSHFGRHPTVVEIQGRQSKVGVRLHGFDCMVLESDTVVETDSEDIWSGCVGTVFVEAMSDMRLTKAGLRGSLPMLHQRRS